MKVMNKIDETAENEFNHFLRINHENILRYFDHFDHRISGRIHTCVITEFCEVCSLFIDVDVKIKNL